MSRTSRTRRVWRRSDRDTADNLYRSQQQAVRLTRTRAYRRRIAKGTAGVPLLGVGPIMAAAHVVEHRTSLRLLPTFAKQDVLSGYPMAGLLALAGIVVLAR